MSVDDDDDGVEPQIEDVDGYYFQDGDEKPVCFSILPIQFGENDNEADFSRKNVFLCGLADKNLVYKEVVAWKTRLDTEQPNIYVLSIEHKWIKLLKPRKCYEKFVRSILITVQMLHFVRRGGQRSCLNRLWDHLDEVFSKYNAKPAADDLMKHLTLIKKFVKKDQTLMKSKILQSLIENGFERTKQALGLEAQFVVSDGRRVRKNDGNNYGYKDDSGDDCLDGDGSIDDGDDSSSDDDGSDNDGTDQICAICDDGGELLSCEGPCKRSFHPTKKDGRESKCETLGYTSAEVKKIGTYLCANCKNKQHQCFRCRELEPSHGPNAKVFQCNHASCGYFYHPKCIAPLLDPNATDGACALERRIMGGMSFPCPIHWCSKCGHMENKTQRALQLAVCRRCTRAYHRKCLPRELSFGTTDKDGNQRAWKLSKTIFIYCLDHEIIKDTGAPIRNHIKFPATPECTKTKEFGNSKARMTRKRRKNTNQSTEPIELSNRLCGAESEQADNVGAKSTSPQIVVEPHCAAKRLKDDPQIEQSIIGASSQNGAETMKGHENQFGISSCLASTETEKRVTCLVPKGTCLGTPYDGPSTKGMSDCSVEDTPVDKDVELDNVACRITEDKYANGREKTQDNYTRKETAHHKDSSENQGHNDVLELDILWVEMQADGSPLEPGNKRDKEWQEDAYVPGSALGQEKETSSSPRSDRGMVPRNDCKIVDSRKGGTTVDNVDDHCSEGSYSCQGEWSRSKCNDCDQDTLSDRSKKRSQSVEKASDGNKTDLDENKKHNLREDGKDAQYEDRRTERNTAADTSRYKCRDKTQSDRREEPEGRSTPAKSREHPPERQRMDHSDSCPETYNRQRCEPSPETYNRQRCELPHSVNSSRSGGGDRRQGSPCQSSFPLAEFGGDHSHLSPRDSQYRTSPQYLGIPQYDTSRMGSPIPHPRMNHTVDWDTFRDHLHAKYDAMDTGPDRNAGAYRAYKTASVAEHSVVCYQLAGGYGDGSRSSRPVTDKYAPHLDRTNCINQRSQSYLPYDLLQLLYNKYVV